jgi:hypothetical protein
MRAVRVSSLDTVRSEEGSEEVVEYTMVFRFQPSSILASPGFLKTSVRPNGLALAVADQE